MANLTKPGLMLAASLLSGCVNPYPQPIVSVSEQEAVAKDANGVRIINPEWQKAKSARGLNVPTNISDLRINLAIYRDLYKSQHQDLVKALNAGDAATVLGGIWGLAGSISGSKAMLYQGLGLAGVTTIYTDHYQLKVQSENYLKASDTMQCMYRVVAVFPDSKELTPEGLRSINISIDDVISRLSRVQRDIVLAQPDLKRLKEALVVNTPTADKATILNFTDAQVDADILPKIEKCVSEF